MKDSAKRRDWAAFCHDGVRIICDILLVIANADVVARLGEGIPGEVKPGFGGEELVGEGVGLEKVDEALELSWILRTDVGSLAYEVLGVFNAPYPAIDSFIPEARIDDDGANDLTGWLQQQMTAIGQIRHNLHRGDILRIFLQI